MASSSVRRIPPPSNGADRRRIRRQHRVSWSDQQSGGLCPPDDRLRERSTSLASYAGTDCASSVASSATSSMYFTAAQRGNGDNDEAAPAPVHGWTTTRIHGVRFGCHHRGIARSLLEPCVRALQEKPRQLYPSGRLPDTNGTDRTAYLSLATIFYSTDV